ncbi:hypothetical protein FDUTEX481_09292 [Tolypothrix sp. PCC 7601]|nr:hypothetical protein FDUTEX481_09292 [Tolypothrix sp. PCC 7601]
MDLSQYLSVKGKKGNGSRERKNLSPLTFSPQAILSSKCLTE